MDAGSPADKATGSPGVNACLPGRSGFSREFSLLSRVAWVPVPVFFIIICLMISIRSHAVWSPPGLISALNIIFLTCISLFVSFLAARSYLAGKPCAVLLLGCGTLALALGGIAASLYISGADTNSMLSVYNTMVCIAGLFHMISAMDGLKTGPIRLWHGRSMLLASYLGVISLTIGLVLLIRQHVWPVHFIEGSGSTVFGMTMLWVTAVLFGLSALCMFVYKARDEAYFRRWYGLGLALISVGLIGISLEIAPGDPINWASLLSEYMGTVYMLVAAIAAIKYSGEWLLPLEKALRESENKYRSFFESSLDAVIIGTIEGGMEAANSAAFRVFGMTEDELRKVGRIGVVDMLDTRYQQALEIWMKKGIFRGEMTFRRKGGEVFPGEVTISQFIDVDGREKVSLVLRDVTERKRAEDALLKSKALQQVLIQNLQAGVVMIDEAGQLAVVNPSVMKIMGLDPGLSISDVLSQDWGRWEFFTEGGTQIPVDKHSFRKLVITGKPVKNKVVSIRTPGARELTWVLANCEYLRKPDGSVEMIICNFNDITDLKRAEKELREAKMQAELYLDLMGHDLNNMHQIAAGYMELARDSLAHGEGEHDYLEKPLEIMQRSAKLIDNVRKLQKVQSGDVAEHVVELGELLSSIVNDYAGSSGWKINYRDGCGPYNVRANELIYDVFSNLVSNAIKHTGNTGEAISVKVDRVFEAGKKSILVSVEDRGSGVPDELKEVIFNRSQRGDTKARGMGLGLYLVKSLVDSYGGKVWVEDRVPGDHRMGARFSVLLPAVE